MHQPVLWTLLALTLLAGASRPARAATLVLATTGSDGGPCSQDQPCATFAHAIPRLQAGDTLVIRQGTYFQTINSQDHPFPSGTSWAQPVTIAAAPGETVVLTGGIGVNTYSGGTIQYVVFDRLILDGTNFFLGGPGTHYIRFQDGEIRNAANSGIQGYGGGTHNEILRTAIHHNGRSRLDHGIYAALPDMLIEGNDIYANAGYGLQIYDETPGQSSDRTILRFNRVHDNLGDAGVTLNHGVGIVFAHNLVYNNPGGVGICRGADHLVACQNTITANNNAGFGVCGGIMDAQLINNILWQNVGGPVDDHGGSTTQDHNYTEEPYFMAPAASDYHLQPHSPARTASSTGGEVGMYGPSTSACPTGSSTPPAPAPPPRPKLPAPRNFQEVVAGP
jgi:Right handed beta helix region